MAKNSSGGSGPKQAGTVMRSHGTGAAGGQGKGHLSAKAIAAFQQRPAGNMPRKGSVGPKSC